MRIVIVVEPLPHAVVMVLAVAKQMRAFALKERSHRGGGDGTGLYSHVEPDQVWIGISEQSALWHDVERHDGGADKGLNPSPGTAPNGTVTDERDCLRLDALNFERRHVNRAHVNKSW